LRQFARGCGHLFPPASELKFTNGAEFEEDIWGLKVCEAADPSNITNRHDWDTENILLTRIVSEVSGRGILRYKRFGLNPNAARHTLVERVTNNSLRLLTLYIYHASCSARNTNVIYISR
jgi:hypothetical protein